MKSLPLMHPIQHYADRQHDFGHLLLITAFFGNRAVLLGDWTIPRISVRVRVRLRLRVRVGLRVI